MILKEDSENTEGETDLGGRLQLHETVGMSVCFISNRTKWRGIEIIIAKKSLQTLFAFYVNICEFQ